MSVDTYGVARQVALNTPEQVPLVFAIAPVGSRLFAFAVDMLVIIAIVVLVYSLGEALVGATSDAMGPFAVEVSEGGLAVMAIVTLITFVVWNFYFIATELRWQGRTVGKRALGLRVIARDGGPLSADLVFARNLTRDVELLLPLSAILNPEMLGADAPEALLLTWLWLGIMAFMPLLNRHHARVGDLVAGTLVVLAPRERLRRDLVDAPGAALTDDGAPDDGAPDDAADDGTTSPDLAFTEAQLELYGVRELQILEDVLRRYPAHVDHDLLATIAAKIQRKIGWEEPLEPPDPYRFLRAFYAAQRARLEHKLLFGERRERKVD